MLGIFTSVEYFFASVRGAFSPVMKRHYKHILLSFLVLWLAWIPIVTSTTTTTTSSTQEEEIANAVSLLKSLGVPKANLCIITATATTHADWSSDHLPLCQTTTTKTGWVRSRRQRYLLEVDEEENFEDRDKWFYITHALCAFACVSTAALAAGGLTMGL